MLFIIFGLVKGGERLKGGGALPLPPLGETLLYIHVHVYTGSLRINECSCTVNGSSNLIRFLFLILSLCVCVCVSCVVWLGEHLVLGGVSGDLHVWEADTLTEVTRHKAHSGMAYSLIFKINYRS